MVFWDSSFNHFLISKVLSRVTVAEFSQLNEHNKYKNIPKTQASYRQDPANTSTMTQVHSHVYTARDGGGKQMYAVNIDGSGHDGSLGIEIPTRHANFFREIGYEISNTNILESVVLSSLQPNSNLWVIKPLSKYLL